MVEGDHNIKLVIITRKLEDGYIVNGTKVNYKNAKYLVTAGYTRDMLVRGRTTLECNQYKYLEGKYRQTKERYYKNLVKQN